MWGYITAFPDFDPHMLELCAGFKEITVDSLSKSKDPFKDKATKPQKVFWWSCLT